MRFKRFFMPLLDKDGGGGGGGDDKDKNKDKDGEGGIPEWAKKMQAELEALKTSITTKAPDVQKIPATKPPAEDKQEQQQQSQKQEQQEAPKKSKSFLDWLL